MALIDVPSAAQLLGVSPRRVRALIDAGRLRARKVGGRWLVERGSAQLLKQSRRESGRPLTPENAWGMLFLASGERPNWLSAWRASRLRARLRSGRVSDVLPRLEGRARPRYLLGSESALNMIKEHPRFVPSGVSAARRYGADVLAPGVIEGYMPASEVERLQHLLALREVDEMRANVILRAVDVWPFADGAAAAPRAVVGADLASSASERAKDAGLQLLERSSL